MTDWFGLPPYAVWRFFVTVTHFGDSALLLPLSLAVFGILLASGYRAAAIRFGLVVGTLMAATFVLKVAFYAVGGDPYLNVLSPSGHAAFSVTVYACCAAALARQLRPAWAVTVIAGAALLIATVLLSRIVLGAHTPQEVAMGGLLGIVCATGFLVRNPELRGLRLRLSIPVILALVIGSASAWAGGHRFNTEGHIERIGVMLGTSLGTLPDDPANSRVAALRRMERSR